MRPIDPNTKYASHKEGAPREGAPREGEQREGAAGRSDTGRSDMGRAVAGLSPKEGASYSNASSHGTQNAGQTADQTAGQTAGRTFGQTSGQTYSKSFGQKKILTIEQTKATSQYRDPAPSRLAYKVNRLWLTPLFRSLFRVGLPVFIVVLAVGWYVSNPLNRTAMSEKWTQLQRSIQERPEFMVKLMAVEGASPLVDQAVREMLPVDFPISSFDLDLDAMRQEITKLDAIAGADLRIRPGGVLEVAVTERVPVLVWHHEGRLDLLDASGHRVARLTSRDARADLALVAGAGASDAVQEALDLLETARPLGRNLRGLVRIGERRWDIVLLSDKRILLPAQAPIAALQQVIALHQAQDVMTRDLTIVDMRNPNRPTLRLAPPAVDELRRIKGDVKGDLN